MNFDRSQFIGKFTQEAAELVQKLNDGLIRLEKEPHATEMLKESLRVVHTLKGSSKIMRFHNMNQIAHKMEDLLISIQDSQIRFSDEIFELLFYSVDLISQGIDEILRHGRDSIKIENICAIFDAAVHGEDISSGITQLRPLGASQNSSQKPLSPADQTPVQEIPPAVNASFERRNERATDAAPEKSELSSPIQETIRVDISRLDNAIRLVGEMIVNHKRTERTLGALKDLQRLVRNHLKEAQQKHQKICCFENSPESRLDMIQPYLLFLKELESVFKVSRDEVAMMDLLLSELYDDVLNMRMLPLAIIFDTFPRAVRDLAKSFNKSIELRMSGEDAMLDKKIIERLNAPLVHILRNCVDHGIETPEERLVQAKARTGLIAIRAYHQNGHIKIEIRDDGQGIQVETLRQRAIQRGILSEESAAAMSQEELLDLVFVPRLSTSELITDISGRGMGMDIVRTSLEQLKGQVTLTSQPGKGTTYLLTLPTTLTTIRCLIISCHAQLFAIPINAIEETLHVVAHEFIEVLGHGAIRLRNQIIYVVSLAEILPLQSAQHSPEQERSFVLITRSNEKRVGLIVDEILDEQDVVVKQLPPHIQKAKTIAGATVSSENTIILILHIPEIVERIKHFTPSPEPGREEGTQAARRIERISAPPRILVVDDSVNTSEIEKQILQAYGYRVDVAHDGVQALEQIANVTYNLIITDIEMPQMDGFTLTERIRELPQYTDIPIVIVSSLERESDKRRGLLVGANAYITKGDFEQKRFIETVKSLI